jgi:hypothetical protein
MKSFSSPTSAEAFWHILSKDGLVQGEQPADPPVAKSDASPWYVKAMLGLGAWLSSLLFLGFIAVLLGSLFGNAGTRALLGIIGCVLAAGYFYRVTPSVFVNQIFFVLALLGQALVLSAIFSDFGRSTNVWLLAAVFEALITLSIPYTPNRFLSALATVVCLHYAAFRWGLAGLVMPASLALLAVALHWQWRSLRLWPVVALALSLGSFFITATQGFFLGWPMRMMSRSLEFGHLFPFWAGRASLIVV